MRKTNEYDYEKGNFVYWNWTNFTICRGLMNNWLKLEGNKFNKIIKYRRVISKTSGLELLLTLV